MTVGGFIFGLIIVVIGYMFVWKSEWLMQNFGRIGFAEKHLGTSGGSRLMYKLIGIIIIIVGFLKATDLSESLLSWVAKTFFGQEI